MNVYKLLPHDMSSKKEAILTIRDQALGVIIGDPLTEFACILSALFHDADHEGVPNTQLAKEHPQLAVIYSGRSIAEQHSVDLAWAMFMSPKYQQLRSTIYTTEAELRRLRQLVVNIVIATDIFDNDLRDFRNARWDKAYSCNAKETRENINRKATIGIEHLIQASDVSHTMQPWPVYR